jgi:hypothetical protein
LKHCSHEVKVLKLLREDLEKYAIPKFKKPRAMYYEAKDIKTGAIVVF